MWCNLVSRARLDSFLFLGGGGKKESGQSALDVSFVLTQHHRGSTGVTF